MTTDPFTEAARKRAEQIVPLDGGEPDLIFRDRRELVAMAEWARSYLISLEEAMVRSLAVASTHTGQDLVEAARIMRAFAQEPTDAERCTACGEDPSGPLRPLSTDERSYRYAQDLGYELPEDPR